MNVIISNYPEDLEVPQEYVENVTAAAQKVGELYGVENGEVSITLTNNDYIHELNRQYRGIDRPTDVISFAIRDDMEFEMVEGMNDLGDIFINIDYARKQAKQYGHSYQREIAFLFTHGMLHCLGYDHMKEEDEKVMFALQDEILDPVIDRNGESYES